MDAHEKYRPDVERRVLEGKCDGACEGHRGETRLVRVTSTHTDWGWFSYCEEARAEDARRGLKVMESAK